MTAANVYGSVHSRTTRKRTTTISRVSNGLQGRFKDKGDIGNTREARMYLVWTRVFFLPLNLYSPFVLALAY